MNPTATLLLCKWLKDRIKGWESEARSQLGLLPGERKAAVVDGAVLGHVTMAKGRKTARVANETALLAWVKAHHPDEIEMVPATERVQPGFMKRLLDDAAKKGAHLDSDGVVIDGLIEVVEGQPYPISKPAEDADITIAALLGRGALGANGLKAIEGGR